MSKSISIGYKIGKEDFSIDIGNRDLLGIERLSIEFWQMSSISDIGIKFLNQIGNRLFVSFISEQEFRVLDREIDLLERNIDMLINDFCGEVRYSDINKRRSNIEDLQGNSEYDNDVSWWISNLRYSYEKVKSSTPSNGRAYFMIG